MKKKFLAVLMAALMTVTTIAGCGSNESGESTTRTEETKEKVTDGEVNVTMSLADASDYFIGTMVGAAVQAAFEEAGATVQTLDAGSDVQSQLNQIQTAITGGADIIYIFPAGDGEAYRDVLTMAENAGVKTLMCANYPGEGYVDTFVAQDEYQMGAMMAAMLSDWADATYPDAGPGEIGVLAVESTFNQNMIKRCLGMRLVGEKFLRKGDMSTVYFVKEEGDPVYYLDEDGKEVEVDEPTGGLILDENGYAQLNPYYNEKVTIIDYSDRNTAGTDSSVAQNAIENTITMGQTNLRAVISYGDTGAAIEAKVRELCADGRISADLSEVATFCSDLTNTNAELIKKSASNESVLRGVMAAGDSIATQCERAKALVAGEEVPEYYEEPLSYIMANEDGSDLVTVYYTDCPQLPSTDLIFE